MKPALWFRRLNMLLPQQWTAWRVKRARQAANRTSIQTPQASPRKRRLYVDVSVISKHDAGTGIQRVVRAIATLLVKHPADTWEVLPVGATRKLAYHVINWPLQSHVIGSPIEGQAGDVFFGLDFALDTIYYHRKQLRDFQSKGGQLWFMMYDLLPVQRPDWFSDNMHVRFSDWLYILACSADGFFCISPHIQSDLRKILSERYKLDSGYVTRVIPMGADLSSAMASHGLPEDFDKLLDIIKQRPTALMVGTLEPRKGHSDVLNAFNILWDQECDINLVLVGRPGWKTEQLQKNILTHPRNGTKLFWLQNATDETLARLYEATQGVIAASYAEGFGLPLIEATKYKKPILARGIPAFLSQCQNTIQYFSENIHGSNLASTINAWLHSEASAEIQIAYTSTWADSAESIWRSLG